jgi:hypothetical protein
MCVRWVWHVGDIHREESWSDNISAEYKLEVTGFKKKRGMRGTKDRQK